ncbi:MAG: hypothetical protein ACP5J9_08875 [Dictyoglomus sp.]
MEQFYAIASRMGAKLLVENNYFETVALPITTQFKSPQDGYVKESGNLYWECGDNNITQELKELRVPYLLDKGAGAGKEVEIK